MRCVLRQIKIRTADKYVIRAYNTGIVLFGVTAF